MPASAKAQALMPAIARTMAGAASSAGAIAEAPAAARLRARLLGLAIHLPALLFLLMVLSPPLNHDVAAVLNFSERWFAGERLYIDLIDVNPPLIFSLNLIPAAIAAWIADCRPVRSLTGSVKYPSSA